jgi:hypothetical protein
LGREALAMTRKARTANTTHKATQGLEKAEAGDIHGARQTEEATKENPEAAEAAEQVASDGPEGRGLAR